MGGKGQERQGGLGGSGGFSWNGGATNRFNAENFGQTIGGDIAVGYSAGPNPGTTQAMQSLTDAAQANSGLLGQGNSYLSGLLGNNGYGAGMGAAIDTVNQIGAQPGNPYLDQIIDQTNDNAYADVMASLGGSGRVGSNIHMDTLGRTLANNESQLRYADSENTINRRLNAANMAFGMNQQAVNNAMGATGMLPTMYGASLRPYEIALENSNPAFSHIQQWTSLLGQQQGAAPQPEKPPGLFDWLGLGLTGAGLLL